MRLSYGNILTEEDFIEYAKKCTRGAFLKYKKLFEDDQTLVRIRKANRACKVFDVLFLRSGPSVDTLNRLIDELAHFEFKEFNEEFLQKMKDEVPKLLKLVDSMPYNFEGEDAETESKLYLNRLKIRARQARQRATLKNIDNHLRQKEEEGEVDYDFESAFGSIEDMVHSAGEDEDDIGQDSSGHTDWKQDIGERSRRIYDWWRTVMNERNGTIPCFEEAVRLVAVVQVSNAAVERVFSQLTFIRRAVGDATLRDVMELRAFIRCNSGLEGDFYVSGDN